MEKAMAEEKVVAREENKTIKNTPNNVKEGGENEGVMSQSGGSSVSKTTPKGKSCKELLFYSSTFKSKALDPLCVGLPRSLPQVPRYILRDSSLEASKEGTEFTFGCLGYSVYPEGIFNNSGDAQDWQPNLPGCAGLLTLGYTPPETAPAHIHNDKQDDPVVPHRPTHKPPNSVGDEFLSKFTRNANLVAMGVAKNVRRVGNHIKESVDDFLNLRKRPK